MAKSETAAQFAKATELGIPVLDEAGLLALLDAPGRQASAAPVAPA